MAAYLVVSLIAGFTCAAVSFLWYGVSLWAMVLFYIAGCWIGFAVTLAVYLLIGRRNDSKGTRWPDRRFTR